MSHKKICFQRKINKSPQGSKQSGNWKYFKRIAQKHHQSPLQSSTVWDWCQKSFNNSKFCSFSFSLSRKISSVIFSSRLCLKIRLILSESLKRKKKLLQKVKNLWCEMVRFSWRALWMCIIISYAKKAEEFSLGKLLKTFTTSTTFSSWDCTIN